MSRLAKFQVFVILIAILGSSFVVLKNTQGEDLGNARNTEEGIGVDVFRPGLVRIDFSITTAEPCNWEGDIYLSHGTFANILSIGISPTSPTDVFYNKNTCDRIKLYTRTPSSFCGFEATVFAPCDSNLEFVLTNRNTGEHIRKRINVGRLIDSSVKIPFDSEGNGIEIARAAADEIPVQIVKQSSSSVSSHERTLTNSSLIFSPGDSFILEALPRSSISKFEGDVVLKASVHKVNDSVATHSEEQTISYETTVKNNALVTNTRANPISQKFSIQAPQEDGVYEILLELKQKVSNRSVLPIAPSKQQQDSKVLSRRIIQFVVVDSNKRPPVNTVSDERQSDLRAELLETIDPSDPTWYKSFSKRSSLLFLKSAVIPPIHNNSEKSKKVVTETNDKNLLDSSKELKSSFQNGIGRSDYSLEQRNENNESLRQDLDVAVLGQAPMISPDSISKIGKNFLKIAPSQNPANMDDPVLNKYVKRWEYDNFQSFARAVNYENWGMRFGLWEHSLSSGNSSKLKDGELSPYINDEHNFIKLEPNRKADGLNALSQAQGLVSWEAYPIPVRECGEPHILEIEYPAKLPQRLGVSIVEPGIMGGIFPTSYDYGIVVQENPLADDVAESVARYSLLFWPKTKNPMILLSNCSSETPAAYGSIRVYKANELEPVRPNGDKGRTLGVSLFRPNLCDQLSVVKKPSLFGVTGAEDWENFDEAIRRTIYYMSASHFDSLMLAVASDGSSLYPSSILNPSPLYDRGIFLASGGDIVRKDVLSLTLKEFKSNNKTLIPLLRLNSTTPFLEKVLYEIRQKDCSPEKRAALEGIEWLGYDRRKLTDVRLKDDGSGSYYNILHPEVEKEVLRIIEELVAKCAPYDSFGGLALDVGAWGWLALPDDVYYGMDDVTISRFVKETNLREILSSKGNQNVQSLLSAAGSERYQIRAEFIKKYCLQEWLEWRIEALYKFYCDIRAKMATLRPDVKLYLVASEALEGPVCHSLLQPSLNGEVSIREALRLVGLDPVRYAMDSKRARQKNGTSSSSNSKNSRFYDPYTVLLCPENLAFSYPLSKTLLSKESTSRDSIALFTENQQFPGVIFNHQAEKRSLYDFNRKSPFFPAVLETSNRLTPANNESCKHYAISLVTNDVASFFDGGASLLMGQENALANWLYVYKSLPPVPFSTWNPPSLEKDANSENVQQSEDRAVEQSIQPLIVRLYKSDKCMWIYLLNVAPFHIDAELEVACNANAGYEVIARASHDAPNVTSESLKWSFAAQPYELAALRINDPQTEIKEVKVTRPEAICGTDGALQQTVQDLVERALAARLGVETNLRNGNFEESFTSEPLSNANNKKESLENSESKTKVDIKRDNEKTALLKLNMSNLYLFKKQKDKQDTKPNESELSSIDRGIDLEKIPGWRVFGTNDVSARLDLENSQEGTASLKISSSQGVGGVVCEPVEPPLSGRLCVQAYFGMTSATNELPLSACLTGRYKGKPFNRRAQIGKALVEELKKQREKQKDADVVWIREAVLFEHLPLDGLEDLSLGFELSGAGTVWIDQTRLYKLAFANSEQIELMRLINSAESYVSKEKVIDVMFMLDSFWANLLKEEVPDDSPLFKTYSEKSISTALDLEKDVPENVEKEEKTSSFFDKTINRIKFW